MQAFYYAVALLYATIPVINTIAYLPQVRKLWRAAPHETRSFSLSSWCIWLMAAIIALAYGITHLRDALFIFVTSIGVFWNVLIIGLIVWKRYFIKPEQTEA